jgi:hypothetical protein
VSPDDPHPPLANSGAARRKMYSPQQVARYRTRGARSDHGSPIFLRFAGMTIVDREQRTTWYVEQTGLQQTPRSVSLDERSRDLIVGRRDGCCLRAPQNRKHPQIVIVPLPVTERSEHTLFLESGLLKHTG